ncbi:restriction endonuclease [Duganella sp. PWIR1]
MTLWLHDQIGEPPTIGEILGCDCRFCRGKLIPIEIDDRWRGISAGIHAFHLDHIDAMAEFHGDFILRDKDFVREPEELDAQLYTCPLCGWWHVAKEIYLFTRNQIWFIECGAAASLKKFDKVDISLPANDVRQYLMGKYASRYNVNPRRFEEVVSSVFSSCGFRTELTSYSSDGGIDVILRDTREQPIAVQVKRHRNTIEVAPIREFIGAMTLNGFTRGAFVTTSRFSRGGQEIIQNAHGRGLTLNLIDAPKFFEHLEIAQVSDFIRYPTLIDDKILRTLSLEVSGESHMNAL